MAARTRARKSALRKKSPRIVRKTRKPRGRPHVPPHRTYTPQLLASGKRRYEQTDESLASIASDFGIHHFSLARMAKRLKWVRCERPPRDLPQASRLLAEAEALEAALSLPPRSGGEGGSGARERDGVGWGAPADCKAPPTPNPSPPLASLMGGGEASAAPPGPVINVEAIDRLEREVAQSIKEVEAARARLKGLPRRPREQEAAARTLATLTNTLQKLRLMRCGLSGTLAHDSYDDDMPADIDAFRDALARRIRAFVESRSGTEGPVQDGEAAVADAPRP